MGEGMARYTASGDVTGYLAGVDEGVCLWAPGICELSLGAFSKRAPQCTNGYEGSGPSGAAAVGLGFQRRECQVIADAGWSRYAVR